MKKKDVILILVLLGVASALLIGGLSLRKPATAAQATPAPSAAPVSSSAPAEAAVSESARQATEEYFEAYPAESYLILRLGDGVYSPIPLSGENSFRITQPDGSENVIHIGLNSFHMESSNCDNQNCVQQEEVTLENRDTRLLFNMIICLPHNLSLEMLTREEAEALLLEMYTREEAVAASASEG